MLKEDLIKEDINNRSSMEKLKIRIKRNIALVISLAALAVGFVMIWYGSVYEDAMQDYLLQKTGSQFLGDWAGTLVMSFVNYFIPWVISLVDNLENWDLASE